MNRTLHSLLFLMLFSGALHAQVKRCATMENLEMLKAQDPGLEKRMEQIERETQQWIKDNGNQRTPNAVITIPVVVHVVYNATVENISDAQVLSGIQVLNEDFRKLNADSTKTPAPFRSVAGDMQIEFCLAKRDPNGAATTGIIRKKTTVTSFGQDNKVKYTAQGGSDAWDRNRYLNLWICNLGQQLLGYAQFPGGAAATDGVVILYTGFGREGTVKAPYHLGRTTTHEVGHWLNLRHIWGDANCGNDQVSDTPVQEAPTSGCPSFPQVSCSNGPNGDMFCNYMDYSYDACMNMFTKGQGTRMLAALNGSRASLKTSNGCTPLGAAPVADFTADVTSTCDGKVTFTDKSTNTPTSWTWDFGDGNVSSLQNPSHTYTKAGTYTVKLTASNTAGNDQETKTAYIKVILLSAPLTKGDTVCAPSGTVQLSASAPAGTLNWYSVPSGGTVISTGNTYSVTLGKTTTFYVEAREGGCVTRRTAVTGEVIVCTGIESSELLNGLLLYPNPASSLLTVQLENNTSAIEISLINLTGQEVYSGTVSSSHKQLKTSVDLSDLPQGVYFIRLTTDRGILHKKIILQR